MSKTLKMPTPEEFWKQVRVIAQRAKRWEVTHNKDKSDEQ